MGAGGRGFESRHPDQRCRSLALCSLPTGPVVAGHWQWDHYSALGPCFLVGGFLVPGQFAAGRHPTAEKRVDQAENPQLKLLQRGLVAEVWGIMPQQ